MIITSNTSLIKTQEYFNKISAITDQNKNRKAVFAFVGGLRNLQLFDNICCWLLIPDQNTGVGSKVISLGGLAPTVHSIGNSLTWTEECVSVNGTSSFLDTSLNPVSLGILQSSASLFVDVISPGVSGVTIGAFETSSSTFGLNVCSKNKVSYSCFAENMTQTSDISGSEGFWLASQEEGNFFIQKNGVTVETTTFGGINTPPNRNLYVGAYNNAGTPLTFTSQTIGCFGFLSGISKSDASKFYQLYKDTIGHTLTQTEILPSPTPSTTPSITPSITPSSTSGITPSPTPSTTPSPTPTPTASQTVSFTNTLVADSLEGSVYIGEDPQNDVTITSANQDIVYYNTRTGNVTPAQNFSVKVGGVEVATISMQPSYIGQQIGFRLRQSGGLPESGPQYTQILQQTGLSF